MHFVKGLTATVEASHQLHADSKIPEDRIIMLSRHAGWEHLLVPAPMTIAFIGQLMLISTYEDFPLDIPLGGFKLLKPPWSFRASVLQVFIIYLSVIKQWMIN